MRVARFNTLFTLAALGLAGCGTHPDSVAPLNVPTEPYANYSCDEIEREIIRLRKEENDWTQKLASKYGAEMADLAGSLAAQASTGVPGMAPELQSRTTEIGALSRVRGEIEALSKVRSAKCDLDEPALPQLGEYLDDVRLRGRVDCLPSLDPTEQLCEFRNGNASNLLAVHNGIVKGVRSKGQDGNLTWSWAPGCEREFSGFECSN